MPLAWLSFDVIDNDPASFFAALIAALQQIEPECGTIALAQLPNLSTSITETRRIIGILINEVLRSIQRPFTVVLDDLHAITTPELYQALDYLLDRLPQHMHLAIATRYAPPLALARLRARGHLAEFLLGDLRFNAIETAALHLFAESLREVEAAGLAALLARLVHSNRHN